MKYSPLASFHSGGHNKSLLIFRSGDRTNGNKVKSHKDEYNQQFHVGWKQFLNISQLFFYNDGPKL